VAFWEGELETATRAANKAASYEVEFGHIRRTSRDQEALISRLRTEAMHLRVELTAPPRVTLLEEPVVVPARRP
jgi:hypothetical protein